MKKLNKTRFMFPGFMRSRWFIGVVVTGVILAGLGAYAWWSQNSWSAYESKYLGVRQDIDAELTRAFSLQSDTPQQRQEKTVRLAELATNIEEMNDSFCHQNALISWQGAFGEYKMHQESCRAIMATTKAFNGQLKPVVEYLQQEQALAGQLSAAPAQSEVAEGDFEGQLTAWRGVHDGIKNASASSDFEPIKQAAVDATEGIVQNWEEVVAAHQTKDKARYVKATQALAAAYDGLQAVASTSASHLAELATKLKEAYTRL